MLVDLRKQYLETGVIFVPRIIEPSLVRHIRVISEHCLCQWRLRAAAAVENGANIANAHVMRHLNDPCYYAGRRQWLVDLLDFVAHPDILAIVREVFNDEVLFRCTSLFMNPLLDSMDGNWHRDSQFTTPDEETEKAQVLRVAENLRTQQKGTSLQLQIALVPSDDSEYVPGSHLRWDSEEEYFIRRADGFKHNRSNLMPGAVRTHQEPGDAAAFHPMGLHRGRYHAERYRRTFMLTYNAVPIDPKPDYFNTQTWCLEPGYLDGVKPETRVFFERFIDRFRGFWEAKP